MVSELRQYKNGFVFVKRMLVLKLSPFFPCRVGEGKKGGNFKTNHLLQSIESLLYFLSSRKQYARERRLVANIRSWST